jgi:DNA polymerase III subunit epsilon
MIITLKNLPVLLVDCQATGSHPDRGHLLEIGWAVIRASDENIQVETCLLNLPEGAIIPPRVTRVTGITAQDLTRAYSTSEAWRRLSTAVRETAAGGNEGSCPAVIHFARYEEPFLRRLHSLHDHETPFPFTFICTHEIAKRLFPDLPRRGLRALAGYFGHSPSELRRTAHHISATACIWRNIVELLENEHGIRSLSDLRGWLAETPGSLRTGRVYPMEREIRFGIPDLPGVYRMMRSNGDILYVGKANSLKRRVSSYFRKSARHAEHILEMLSQARNLEFTPTGSCMEAAVFESDEIKRLLPPYNVSLRKGSRMLWFCSTDYRHFSPEADEDHPIGPFPSQELLSFSAIIDLLKESDILRHYDFDMIAKAMGMPTEYAPDQDCSARGFELFHQSHSPILDTTSLPGGLFVLGMRFWRRMQEESPVTEQASDLESETDLESAQSDDWTPEKVAGAFENVILRGAWLIRRAKWFCLLSESVLSWEEHRDGNRETKILTLERGALVKSLTRISGKEIPLPREHGKSFQERQKSFDVPTYDRMRVITTELRRLVTKGGNIDIRLTPTVLLDHEKLNKVLELV